MSIREALSHFRTGAVIGIVGTLLLAASLTACGDPQAGTVTYKIVEHAHKKKSCEPDAILVVSCGRSTVPTSYRVELTYDKAESDHREPIECWIEVTPDDYEEIALGDPVLLSDPDWSACGVEGGLPE